MNILIVDDDADATLELQEIIASEGYYCEVANDPRTAIKLVKNTEFDALICDFHMPGINGLELLRLIREINPIGIEIMVSGVDNFHSAITGNEKIVNYVIKKPLNPDDILEILDNSKRKGFSKLGVVECKLDLDKFLSTRNKDFYLYISDQSIFDNLSIYESPKNLGRMLDEIEKVSGGQIFVNIEEEDERPLLKISYNFFNSNEKSFETYKKYFEDCNSSIKVENNNDTVIITLFLVKA
jgi:CheY-like chemotaxis protein